MSSFCEHCGSSFEEENAFCTRCGARREANGERTARPFCTKCGSLLSGTTNFCTKCGANAGSSSGAEGATTYARSASSESDSSPFPQTPAQTPNSVAPSGTKVLIVALAAVLLLAGSITAGLVYVAHRVRQKVTEINAASAISSHRSDKGAASSTSSSSSRAPSADNSDFATAMKDLGNLGAAETSRSASPDQAETPEGQAQSLADAALVSQAILRNLDRSPTEIPQAELPTGTGPISMPTPDSYSWSSAGAKILWQSDIVKVTFARGTSVYGQCAVIKRDAAASVPTKPAKATGNQDLDWKLQFERTEGGPEAELVVRTGDINNLGFGWPQGFDPFSGKSTPPHPYPWNERPGSAAGTDRIMLASGFRADDTGFDGYSHSASCGCPRNWAPCENRLQAMPVPIVLQVGRLPSKIHEVLLQMFVDDFQAARFQSHFQVSLNGIRIPSFEYAINSLDQTGPIGKLVTFKLLPEYWPLLKTGEVKLLIDDPTTHIGDGYAVDFARILVNPRKLKYQVDLSVKVMDADQHTPISGATVTAAVASASTDAAGKCQLSGLPAGLVVATAAAPGFDENSTPVDLVAGQSGSSEILLHRHHEDTTTLETELKRTGQATVYGIHFDTDSEELRPDSLPALNAVLGLINNHPNSSWIISGHTDNQGDAAHNQVLSDRRSASVIAWLREHGINPARLAAQGFGATRPVADNNTANGRALNRRVEVALSK